MSDEPKILRKWTGVIRTADEQVYVDYIKATGLEDYKSTPGISGFRWFCAPEATAPAK